MPLLAICPCYEAREETVDNALFGCPRAVRIWTMADLLPGVSLMEYSTQLFVESLRSSMDSKLARINTIWMAYVTYHIWPFRNN